MKILITDRADGEGVDIPSDIAEQIRLAVKLGIGDPSEAGVEMLRDQRDRVMLEKSAYRNKQSAWAVRWSLAAEQILARVRTNIDEVRLLADLVSGLRNETRACLDKFHLAIQSPMPPIPRDFKPEIMLKAGSLANDDTYASALSAAVKSKTQIGRMDALAAMVKELSAEEKDFRRVVAKLEKRVAQSVEGTPERAVAVRLARVKRDVLDTLRKRKEDCFAKWIAARRAALNEIIGRTEIALAAMGGECSEMLCKKPVSTVAEKLIELDAEYMRENKK